MTRQTKLFRDSPDSLSSDGEDEIEESVEQQKRESRYDTCDLCGKEEPKDSGRIEWFNGGNLLDRNPDAHEQCYRQALREHGFEEPGYTIVSEKHHCWQLFSASTGIEQFDPRDVETISPGRMADSDTVFQHSIVVSGYEYGEVTDRQVWGVTEALCEALVDHGYVEWPDELER